MNTTLLHHLAERIVDLQPDDVLVFVCAKIPYDRSMSMWMHCENGQELDFYIKDENDLYNVMERLDMTCARVVMLPFVPVTHDIDLGDYCVKIYNDVVDVVNRDDDGAALKNVVDWYNLGAALEDPSNWRREGVYMEDARWFYDEPWYQHEKLRGAVDPAKYSRSF